MYQWAMASTSQTVRLPAGIAGNLCSWWCMPCMPSIFQGSSAVENLIDAGIWPGLSLFITVSPVEMNHSGDYIPHFKVL